MMTACIEHTQGGSTAGYGTTVFTDEQGRGSMPLHRATYLRHNGLTRKDVAGLHVRHTCDNSRCINVEHLLLGTAKENGQDKVDRKRSASHARNGRAVLTAEEVASIREDTRSQRTIAKEYGVGKTTVGHIKAGRTWT